MRKYICNTYISGWGGTSIQNTLYKLMWKKTANPAEKQTIDGSGPTWNGQYMYDNV